MSKIISILQESSERVESVDLISPDTDVKVSETQIPVYSIQEGKIRFKFLSGEDDVLLPVNTDESSI